MGSRSRGSQSWGSVLFVVAAFSLAAHAEPSDSAGVSSVEVTYLANEGFLIERDGVKVVIDGIFGAGLPEYDTLPGATQSDLEAATGPAFAMLHRPQPFPNCD